MVVKGEWEILGSEDVNPHVATVEFNGTQGSLEVLGYTKVSGDIGALDLNFVTLFANVADVNQLTGWIGEFIVFDREFTPKEIKAMQNYLNRWL